MEPLEMPTSSDLVFSTDHGVEATMASLAETPETSVLGLLLMSAKEAMGYLVESMEYTSSPYFLHYLCVLLQLLVLSFSGFSLLKFMNRYRSSVHDTVYGMAHFTLVLVMCLKASFIIFNKYSLTVRAVMGLLMFATILILLLLMVWRDNRRLNNFGDLEEGSLHLAAMSGDNAQIKYLVKKGHDPDHVGCDLWEGYPPIFAAIHQGLVETVATLLDSGADVNWQYKNGTTPLHFTIRMFHLLREEPLLRVFELLLSRKGIDFDRRALPEDVHASIPPRWSFHLDQERRVTKQRIFSGTPLGMSIRLGCSSMAQKLIRRGANIDLVSVDFRNDFRYSKNCLYPLKLLYFSGFKGFPQTVDDITAAQFANIEEEQDFVLFKDWLSKKLCHPMSLKELSRARLRHVLGTRVHDVVWLDMPRELIKYVKFADVTKKCLH